MQLKFFLTLLGAGTLALIDNTAQAQNKKHVKIIEIVDGDTTITEKTIDEKSTAKAEKADDDGFTFAYSYTSDDKDENASRKTVKKSSKSENVQISIDMDDDKENFKKVMLKNKEDKANVFLLEVETNKDLPFNVELKDASEKTVFQKEFKTGKKLNETLDLSGRKKGSYTLTVKQGKETVSNHTLTVD